MPADTARLALTVFASIIGIITALVGVPLFMALVLARRGGA